MQAAGILNATDATFELRQQLQQRGYIGRGHLGNHAILPLLEALQWRGDSRALFELLELHPRELGWRDLANIMRTLGYASDERATRLAHVRAGDLPALFLPSSRDESPMVITEATQDGFLARVLTTDAIKPIAAGGMPGTLVRFHAADPPEIKAGSWFRGMLQKFRGQFRDVLILGFLINGFALAVPLFTMLTYDRVIAGRNVDTLYYLLIGVAVALGMEAVLRGMRAMSLAWFGVRANHIIGVTLFERLLAIEPLSIERAPAAAQVVRAKAMESVRDFLTGQGFILFIEFPFIPLLLLALLLLAPTMALACFATAIVLLALLATQLRGVRLSAQRSARAMSQRQRDALEMFS